MTILVTYEDDENINIRGIDRVSPNTLISNVSCTMVWMVCKTYVGGKVKKSLPINKQDLLKYIWIPSSPSKTYGCLRSDAISHAFSVIDNAGWALQPVWTVDKASGFVKLTKKWFDICGEFMKVPTGYVTDKKKFRDVVQVAISEYIMAQKHKKQALKDPLDLLPQLNYLPKPGEDLNCNLHSYVMALLDKDLDSDSDSMSIDF